MSTIDADVANTPLNHGSRFAKEKDVILTNDYWRIIDNFVLTVPMMI
jgi:hypothetical protein